MSDDDVIEFGSAGPRFLGMALLGPAVIPLIPMLRGQFYLLPVFLVVLWVALPMVLFGRRVLRVERSPAGLRGYRDVFGRRVLEEFAPAREVVGLGTQVEHHRGYRGKGVIPVVQRGVRLIRPRRLGSFGEDTRLIFPPPATPGADVQETMEQAWRWLGVLLPAGSPRTSLFVGLLTGGAGTGQLKEWLGAEAPEQDDAWEALSTWLLGLHPAGWTCERRSPTELWLKPAVAGRPGCLVRHALLPDMDTAPMDAAEPVLDELEQAAADLEGEDALQAWVLLTWEGGYALRGRRLR